MCLAIPYPVVEVGDDDHVTVAVGSGRRRCFAGLVEPLEVGDWVLMHAGFALARVAPAEAEANRALIARLLEGERRD